MELKWPTKDPPKPSSYHLDNNNSNIILFIRKFHLNIFVQFIYNLTGQIVLIMPKFKLHQFYIFKVYSIVVLIVHMTTMNIKHPVYTLLYSHYKFTYFIIITNKKPSSFPQLYFSQKKFNFFRFKKNDESTTYFEKRNAIFCTTQKRQNKQPSSNTGTTSFLL